MAKAYITSVQTNCMSDDFTSEVTLRVQGGFISPNRLMGLDFDEILPGNVVVKCGHCQQWGARKTACKHCGAPIG